MVRKEALCASTSLRQFWLTCLRYSFNYKRHEHTSTSFWHRWELGRAKWEILVPLTALLFHHPQCLQNIVSMAPRNLLHTEPFTHRSFYTQELLHTDAFTHRRFYTQTLLHRHFLHTEVPFYLSFDDQTSFRAKGLSRTRENRNFTSVFPESACEGFFLKASRCNTSSHPHICWSTSSHPHTCRSRSSHPHICWSTSSHPHICWSTSSHPHICWSTSSHPHICWSTSSHPHICWSTSSHPHICWSSPTP